MIGLIVFGAISFSRMGISQLPDVDFPVLNVSISWTGASPETMESAVVDVVEDSIMTIEGVRNVTSKCQEGLSNITVEFELNRDIDAALQEVNTKIAQAQKLLPVDIDPPIVTKSNPEDQPIMFITLYGGSSLRETMLFARDHLKDALATIPGVGDIRFGGYVDPNMRIGLNVDQMREKQLAVDDVIATITTGTTLTPSGYMDNGPREVNIRVIGEVATQQEFEKLVVPSRGGAPVWTPIHLGSVARVEEGLADVRRISRVNGNMAVGLGIVKQRGSNAVAVGRSVKARLISLGKELPKGMNMLIVNDSTRFIEASSRELIFSLTLAAILTSLVCWLFLGSFSSAINVVLAIPTSLIGAFIILYFCGFTLNTFTLLALSLSIGIVVDDAIMVLENIVRHREMGSTRVKAALVGAREITPAAVAASVAILAIFLPVIFMRGIIGKFFYQFGVAMSVAVSLSLLEALTLAPMRCSQFLQSGHQSALGRWIDRGMEGIAGVYKWLLRGSLHHRWAVIFMSLIIFGGSLFLLQGTPKEFVPPQDQNRFLMTIQTPMGSSLDFTDSVFRKAEAILKERPEIESYYTAVGGFQGGLVNQGNLFVMMKDPSMRPVAAPFHKPPHQSEYMPFIRGLIQKIPGVSRATVLDLSLTGFSAQRGFPVQFALQGPDWEKLAFFTQKIMSRMSDSGLMTDVDTDYNPNMPETKVIPNREKAAIRGVTVSNISNAISALVGSLRVGRYTDDAGHRDDIRIKLLDQYNRTPKDIRKIWVRNSHGEILPLSEVVAFQDQSSLLTISRFNRERSISVFANVAPGKSQSDAMGFVEREAKTILTPGYHLVASGGSQTFKESFESLMVALILGIFVAYMVLGSQFNSFIHPFTVLLALPFSVTGALIALRVFGLSLNIFSMIGLLLLMGIVKKNSILLVDFTNQLRGNGLDVREALLKACPLRLRPILMTSIATMVAAIPAASALGPGAEVMRPMAVVTIGGVAFSTLLTLFVVPCAYSLLARMESHRHSDALREALASG